MCFVSLWALSAKVARSVRPGLLFVGNLVPVLLGF